LEAITMWMKNNKLQVKRVHLNQRAYLILLIVSVLGFDTLGYMSRHVNMSHDLNDWLHILRGLSVFLTGVSGFMILWHMFKPIQKK